MITTSLDSDRRGRNAAPRWYQFSLRGMIALTGIIGGFFSLALALGYVDAVISSMALTLLFAVIRCPRQARFVTGVLLTGLAALMLWANLRPTGLEMQFCQEAPRELDSLTRGMFWRGWPVSPWMLCEWRHMALDARYGLPEAALVVDGAVFLVGLFAAKAACERCLRLCERKNGALVDRN